ncbi:hypothetical protein [Paenibacillus tarimensis]|uniref:hypothetical protein n=1 Tax=Paenibacillus tarimensis TaxID=416012 RepID=UPI0039F09E5E
MTITITIAVHVRPFPQGDGRLFTSAFVRSFLSLLLFAAPFIVPVIRFREITDK